MYRTPPGPGTSLSPLDSRLQVLIGTMSRLPGFERVRFIILYGSMRNGGAARPDSDIDLCLYYEGDPGNASRFRHTLLSLPGSDMLDIQIFSQLPLYVRMEVLKGRVVFAPDIRFVYDTAVRTIREFNDFRHRLDDYTGVEAIS